QGGPGGRRHLSSDDAVPAHQPGFGVEQMHRSAPAAGDTVLAAEQLRHDLSGIESAHQRIPVDAVVREQIVPVLQCSHETDDNSLLAEVEVTVSADLRPGV